MKTSDEASAFVILLEQLSAGIPQEYRSHEAVQESVAIS
jgi:hypothetical protein